jgi:Leucine-rich repeat (LRR) protein
MAVEDRIAYIAEKFNVYDESLDYKVLYNDVEELCCGRWKPFKFKLTVNSFHYGDMVDISFGDFLGKKDIGEEDNKIYAIKYTDNGKTKYGIPLEIFKIIVSSDPTQNKEFVQWLTGLYINIIKPNNRHSKPDESKEHTYEEAFRFIEEDVIFVSDNLKLFEQNKYKDRFSELVKKDPKLKHIKHPSDINQYKSLSELFIAVLPFVVKSKNKLQLQMESFALKGDAEILFDDGKWVVYVPLTINASVIFFGHVDWCTAKPGNSNFNTYTENNRLSNNTSSKLFIVVSYDYLNEINSNELYQLHFETNQLHNKDNVSVDFYKTVLTDNTNLRLFFENTLIGLAKLHNSKSPSNNNYLKYLVKFGRADLFFETLNTDSTELLLLDDNIPLSSIPDNISRFKNIQQLVCIKNSINKISKKLYECDELELISLVENKISELPDGIGKLKKLFFLNLYNNKITSMPSDIHLLDKSNGGSLENLILSDNTPQNLINELKNKLPNVNLKII